MGGTTKTTATKKEDNPSTRTVAKTTKPEVSSGLPSMITTFTDLWATSSPSALAATQTVKKEPEYIISDDVGNGGKNLPADVKVVQTLLYKAGYNVTISGLIDKPTIDAIVSFQKTIFNTPASADGLVTPFKKTITKLKEYQNKSRILPRANTKNTEVQKMTHVQIVQQALANYKNGTINMVSLGSKLKQNNMYCPKTVINVINALDSSERDNLAYTMVNQSSDAELADFNILVLEKLSSELGSWLNTTSWAENGKQKKRVDKIISTKKTTSKTSNAVNSSETVHPLLGGLSEQYESQGVGTVSGGQGDAGGVSYGNWQLASKKGRPKEFLENEGIAWADDFGTYKPGSKEFSKVWKEIAATDGDAFKLAQHSYIKRTHYDVVHSSIEAKTGLVVNARSQTLQDVLWSTAVQHGPNNKIFIKALDGKDISELTDAEIIKAIYAERGKLNEDGNLAYFSNNSKEVQNGVAARFVKEQKRALELLAKEEEE